MEKVGVEETTLPQPQGSPPSHNSYAPLSPYFNFFFFLNNIFKYIFLFIICLFIFGERGREGEREGKKHQCVVASRVPPTGDLACNPGMCPDWESNLSLIHI